jgi:hypothetical protein|tara:strand:- start:130 stop:579 length:450 start_codon:yes stop_codon:yes gene_type:complete
MAKYLNFHLTGAYSASGGAAAPELDGDQLVQLGQISTFTVTTTGTNGGGNADAQIVLNLAGLPATSDVVTINFGTNADATASTASAPFIGTDNAAGYAAYNVQMKKAIVKAIKANPGGTVSSVIAPLAQEVNAKYDPANRVYFKDFAIG